MCAYWHVGLKNEVWSGALLMHCHLKEGENDYAIDGQNPGLKSAVQSFSRYLGGHYSKSKMHLYRKLRMLV